METNETRRSHPFHCIPLISGLIETKNCLIVYYFVKGNRLGNPRDQYRIILKSATPITGVRVATSALQPIIAIIIPMQLVLAGMSNENALAEFGIAVGMTMPLLFVPSTLTGSLAMVLLPELSSQYAQKNKENVIIPSKGDIMAYIEFDKVDKIYQTGEVKIKALNDTTFTIEKGELVCILGPSGAGKTTCLNILGGMDKLTNGKVIVDGKRIDKLSDKELIKYRRNDIGFVFQFYNLIQNMTVLENVELAIQLCSDYLDPNMILDKVGLKNRKNNFPAQLSGGEQQRVAIARAIAKNPKLLLCDEPTGALDYKTGKQILKLLEDTCRKEHMTVVIITHNSAIAGMADKVIKFKNGSVSDIIINKSPQKIEDIEW